MLLASTTHITPGGSSVIATNLHHTVPALLAIAQGGAGRLPSGWFKPVLVQDEDEVAGLREDFVLLDRVGGAPVGSFSVHQASAGCFDVYAHPEDDSMNSPRSLGQFASTNEALDGIMVDIATTLSVWGVGLAS